MCERRSAASRSLLRSAGTLACTPAIAASQTGTATTVVVRPNTLMKIDDLDFGTIVSGADGRHGDSQCAHRRPHGDRRCDPGRHDTQRAIFQGTGGILLITVSGDTSVTLTRAGGGAPTMTASLVRAASTSGGGIALLGGTLLPSGVQTYYIGGTLNVGANQPAGDYSGTFTLPSIISERWRRGTGVPISAP